MGLDKKWEELIAKTYSVLGVQKEQQEESNLVAHARRELSFLKAEDSTGMNAMMYDNLIELVDVFAKQGHSGFSAAYLISNLAPLLKFEPIGPLTGKPAEWVEACEGMWQNKRCGHVFAEDAYGANAYDSQGVIFREPNGCGFISKGSRVSITFPYSPTTVYADVPEDATEEEKLLAREKALAT